MEPRRHRRGRAGTHRAGAGPGPPGRGDLRSRHRSSPRDSIFPRSRRSSRLARPRRCCHRAWSTHGTSWASRPEARGGRRSRTLLHPRNRADPCRAGSRRGRRYRICPARGGSRHRAARGSRRGDSPQSSARPVRDTCSRRRSSTPTRRCVSGSSRRSFPPAGTSIGPSSWPRRSPQRSARRSGGARRRTRRPRSARDAAAQHLRDSMRGLFNSEDAREAVAAMLAKRPPTFQGR